jgi:hypothetical protein
VQIGANDLVRSFRRVGNPAWQLFHVELTASNAVQREDLINTSSDLLRIKRKSTRRFVADLD